MTEPSKQLQLFARHVDWSDGGVLNNAYVISPMAELNEIVSDISTAIEASGLTVSAVKTEYPTDYDAIHGDAQDLLLTQKEKIYAQESDVMIIVVTGFEKFYTAPPGFYKDTEVRAGMTGPRVSRQHNWDQDMVESTYFHNEEYKNLFGELHKKNKKVFCLFHIGDGPDPNVSTVAKNSIEYSHFSALKTPLVIRPLQQSAPSSGLQAREALPPGQ